MSPELIGILGVGAALAALLVGLHRGTDKRIDRLDDRLGNVERRLEWLVGLLQGKGVIGDPAESPSTSSGD